ncbi:MAG: hypothetical protein ACYSWQ_01835 [Planctomycetota bacterium]|jgi:hypothetical protein
MKRKSKHTRRRFKIWHGVVVLLLLLFVLFRISGGYRLKKRLQALQNQGHPATLEDLERSYSLPAGVENAADVYLAAFSKCKKWDKDAMRGVPIAGGASMPARTEPLDAPARQNAKRFLSGNEQALSLLYKAASIEHCRYRDDLTPVSNEIKYRRYGMGNDVLTAARLLRLEALIASEDKDVDKFLASISTSLALARSIDGPLMIHRSTHDTVLRATYGSIQRTINRTPLTDEQLVRLSALVKESDDDKGFKRALLAEQCLGLHKFIAPLKEVTDRIGEQESAQFRALVISRMLGSNSRHALGYIDLMQKSIDALELPDPDRLKAFEAVGQSAPRNKQGRIIRDVLTLDREIERQARARLTLTALAVERYRLAEGHLPQSLGNLVPAYMKIVPEDPFDGQHLRYRKLKTGFVVYSVNDDLSDNGGAKLNTKKLGPNGKLLPWDITFTVER